jgi:ribosomal protein S9
MRFAIAISKAAAALYTGGKKAFIASYDRALLVDDPRQAEPKKPKPQGVRGGFKQKSL